MFKKFAMAAPFLGAAAGFLGGGDPMASSPTTSAMGRFEGGITGGLAGIGVGAALLGGPSALKGIGRSLLRPRTYKTAFGLGRGAVGMGLGAINATLRNPKTAMMLAGTGIGAVALARSGPGSSQLTEAERQQIAVKQGGTSYLSAVNSQFQQSVQGLTLGLHSARHR